MDQKGPPMTRVAVAGCGRMGLGMCRALVGAGFDAKGFDVRPASDYGAFAAHMLADADALKHHAEVLFTVVRDTTQTDDLLFDDQAVLVGETAVETLVVSSTLSPNYVKALADRVPEGIVLIDAPMSGAQVAADERRLSFMLGGDDAALDAIQPMLDAMGNSFHRMGGFGAGMTAKVLNNYVAASSAASTRKVLAWAEELGLDQAKLLALMHASSGQTWFGSNFDKIEFTRDGYHPDNTIHIIAKDVEAALDGVGAPDDAMGRAFIEVFRNLKPMG